MNSQYEVLGPWAEVDSFTLRRISPRLTDLAGKTIGLFCDAGKGRASIAIRKVVEEKLKERLPNSKFSSFFCSRTGVVNGVKIYPRLALETEEKEEFLKWVKGVDAVITAVGD